MNNKIKLIDTGKTKILAVMVPEDATNVRFRFKRFLTYRRQYSSHIEMFNEACNLLGFLDQLTEEQWRELVTQKNGGEYGVYGFCYEDFSQKNLKPYFNNAKESGLSLLEANGCFSVNPYGENVYDKTGRHMVSDQDYQNHVWKWQQAQENTGRWLILASL